MNRGHTESSSDPGAAWTTELVDATPNRVVVRGREIGELMRGCSFAEAVWLLWTGRDPEPWQAGLMDMALVSAIDHGPRSPATTVARTAAATGNTLLDAAAIGLLATGPHHGAAVTPCAWLLLDAPEQDHLEWARQVQSSFRARGERIPGIGHRSHTEDPRSMTLFTEMARLGVGARWMAAIRALAEVVGERRGAPACINVDGALAVVTLAVGLDPSFGNGIFGLSRLAGLTAHAVEERTLQRPMRDVVAREARYAGPTIQD